MRWDFDSRIMFVGNPCNGVDVTCPGMKNAYEIKANFETYVEG